MASTKEVTPSNNLEVWDSLEKFEGFNIYHTEEFYEAFSKPPGFDVIAIGSYGKNGELMGFAQVMFISEFQNPVSKYFSQRAICMGGILYDSEEYFHSIIKSLRSICKKRNSLYLKIRLHFPMPNQETLQNLGINLTWSPHLNFVFDFSNGIEGYWNKLTSKHRNQIKRAEKKGLKVQSSILEDINPLFENFQDRSVYSLLAKNYTRVGLPFYSEKTFKQICKPLVSSKKLGLLTGSIDGEIVGFRILLLNGKNGIDWFAAVSSDSMRYNVNDALVWHTFKFCEAQSVLFYDFGGAGNPNVPYGVRDFKAKFKGELTNYGDIYIPISNLRIAFLSLAKKIYGRLKRF